MKNFLSNSILRKGAVFEIQNGNEIVIGNKRLYLKNIYANGEYVVYNSKTVNANGFITSSGENVHKVTIEVKAINTIFAEKICFTFTY